MKDKKKMLVFHQGALGDLIMAFPVLRHLRSIYSKIDGVCKQSLGKLACHLRIFDTCFPLESAVFASLWSDSPVTESRLVHLFDSYDEIFIFSFSRHLEDRIRKISKGTVFRIQPRPPLHQRIHVAQFIWDQLAFYDLLPAGNCVFPEIKQAYLSSLKKILIPPGSGSLRKNWPLNNFIRVYEILKADGMEAEFILGPAEEFLAEDLDGLPVHCTSDLSDLTGIMKNAAGCLGNDSGLTHLAAFLGLPVTAIFGPSDPLRWKPLGNVRILRPSDLKCSPCFETEKQNCADSACLNRISADMAARMVREMLE